MSFEVRALFLNQARRAIDRMWCQKMIGLIWYPLSMVLSSYSTGSEAFRISKNAKICRYTKKHVKKNYAIFFTFFAEKRCFHT